MKTKGIIRKADELGRIVIPKEMRRKLDIDVGTPLEMHLEGDTIVMKRDHNACIFCRGENELEMFKGKPVCAACRAELKN